MAQERVSIGEMASWYDGGDSATGKATGKLFIDAAINTVHISVVGASLACFNVF